MYVLTVTFPSAYLEKTNTTIICRFFSLMAADFNKRVFEKLGDHVTMEYDSELGPDHGYCGERIIHEKRG
jgi:hypothetical protein